MYHPACLSTAKSLAASQSEFLYPAPALVKAKEVPLGVPIAHPSFISSSIAECARVTSPPKSDASSPIKTVSPAWWPDFFRSFSIVRASSLSCGIGFSLRYPFFQDCDNITNFTGSDRVWRIVARLTPDSRTPTSGRLWILHAQLLPAALPPWPNNNSTVGKASDQM